MNNSDLIKKFYTAFSKGNAEEMISCYHSDIEFKDPAFGTLKSEDAKNMWRMLVARSKNGIQIEYSNISADNEKGKANWKATYVFSPTGRKVINVINAKFEFKDGKIIKHHDHFDIWKWSRQALGLPGLLLGWTPILKRKIKNQAVASLKQFIKKNKNA